MEAVLKEHPGSNVVFLGDLFEFSATGAQHPDAALGELLTANPRFCAALRRHTASGGQVHWVAGNHDAALAAASPGAAEAAGIDVTVWPWFMRVGSVHLEHGHLFDRDNAPLHPLARWDIRDEPLGIALMRRIVVELDIPMWAHAHQTTPARAVSQAARWFGWRLPVTATRVFGRLVAINLSAVGGRWGRVRSARRHGQEALAAYAAQSGLAESMLERVIASAPPPTHTRWGTAFRRLYLDWVSALGAAGIGALVGFASGSIWPWVATVAGASYVAKEGYFRRESRYPPPLDALRAGAHQLVRLTGASRVIFGHTHVEEDDGVYANLGSFGYANASGRAYALVTEDGTFTRRHLPPA